VKIAFKDNDEKIKTFTKLVSECRKGLRATENAKPVVE
jgi:hypothetical protein